MQSLTRSLAPGSWRHALVGLEGLHEVRHGCIAGKRRYAPYVKVGVAQQSACFVKPGVRQRRDDGSAECPRTARDRAPSTFRREALLCMCGSSAYADYTKKPTPWRMRRKRGVRAAVPGRAVLGP